MCTTSSTLPWPDDRARRRDAQASSSSISINRTERIYRGSAPLRRRSIAGPVTVRIGDWQTTMDCVVSPPQSEPVIGSTVLATVDLAADEATGTVWPGRGARDRATTAD